MYLLVIKQLLIMLIIAASSFGLTKAYKFGKTEQQFVSKILLMYINPCLILSHFDLDFDLEKLKSFAFVFVLSLAVHILMAFIAWIFIRSKREDGQKDSLDCLDKMSVVLSNCGFIGIPLISGVLGEEGVFYLLAFITTFNIATWTYGYFLMAGKVRIRKILTNPNIISVILGILIFCLPFKLPEVISKPIKLVGSMNTAMAMFLLGMLFANFQKSENSSYVKRLVRVALVKYILEATAVFLLIFAVYRLFPGIKDIRLICYVVFIASLCPAAMSVSSMAVIFEKDESYSALLCMTTSLLCVLFLPLAVGLAERAI
ncbi:MAG: AEC family transporter [Treponema sp.]|nr:AEC family transporter [Treponema sp.]